MRNSILPIPRYIINHPYLMPTPVPQPTNEIAESKAVMHEA